MKEKKQEYEELQMDKLKWEENKTRIESMYSLPENIIDLDIGGTHKITTTKTTLCTAPDSTLAAMFSGRHKLNMHNGRVFIDRDGDIFCLVINFLRTGKVPLFESKAKET